MIILGTLYLKKKLHGFILLLPSGDTIHHGWWKTSGHFFLAIFRLCPPSDIMCGSELVVFSGSSQAWIKICIDYIEQLYINFIEQENTDDKASKCVHSTCSIMG